MPGFDIVLMKEYKTIAAKYTFLPSAQVKKKALEKLKKSNPKNTMKSEKSVKKKSQPSTDVLTTFKMSFDDEGKRKRSIKPLKVDIFPAPAPKKSLLRKTEGIKRNGCHVSFNNDPEIRYRTESEASSASTSRKDYAIAGIDDYIFQSIEQNIKTYTRKGADTLLNKEESEKENTFNQLLKTKCSWSYKQMNSTNDGSLSPSQNTDSSPQFIPNVKQNKSNNSKTKKNTLKMDCFQEIEQNVQTKNVHEAIDENFSPSSFDSLLPKNTPSPSEKPQNKSNVTRERKNLRSLKPVNYANDSSSDEELVLQSRVYNKSKFDESDEDEMENGKKNKDGSKDEPDAIKLGESGSCDQSSQLNTDIPNSSDHVLNQDSYRNTSQNENLDEDSISSNILFTNKVKLNESLGMKSIGVACSSDNSSKIDSNINNSRNSNMDEDPVTPNISFSNETRSKKPFKLQHTDISSTSDNSSNKDFIMNALRKNNEDDESVSPKKTISKVEAKTLHPDEKVIRTNRSKTPPLKDSKKQTKSKSDDLEEINTSSINDSDNCNEKSIRKSPASKEKDFDPDFNDSFFRTSFPGLSNDEAIGQVSEADYSVFGDSDSSTDKSPMKESTESLHNVSKNTVEHLSNKDKRCQGLQEVTQKGFRVKEKLPSKIPSRNKRISNVEGNATSIQNDNEDVGQIFTTKHQKKHKGTKIYDKGLRNDIKKIHDDISSEVLSIGNKSDMTGSLSEDDEFTRDFMDGNLDCNKLHKYYKFIDIQNNQPSVSNGRKLNSNSKIQNEKEFDASFPENISIEKQHRKLRENCKTNETQNYQPGKRNSKQLNSSSKIQKKKEFNVSLHEDVSTEKQQRKLHETPNYQPGKSNSKQLNSSSKIQKEKEFNASLQEDVSTEKQNRTQNKPVVLTNAKNKSKKAITTNSSNLVNDDTSSYFQELTGTRKQKEGKYKPKKYHPDDHPKIQSTSKPLTKNQGSQELDNLVSNDSYGSEIRDCHLTVRNTNIQSDTEEKKESKSKRSNKNTVEESFHLSTPSLSPLFLTMPVKRKKVADLITTKTICKSEEFNLKVQKKDEADILDSLKKKPLRSWEDLEAEILSDGNKNASEESLALLEEDTNALSNYENIKIPKVEEKQRNVNTSKRFSILENSSKNALSKRSPQMKYVFNKSPQKVDIKGNDHDGNDKSTSLVPYTSSASIVAETIEKMNRTTSSYLKQYSEKYQPLIGRNYDRSCMDGVPVEFSYSIHQIKSTMYIKPSKQVQDLSSENKILNTRLTSKSDKQNKITDNNMSPKSFKGQFLPAFTIATSNEQLVDGMPAQKNKLTMKVTQKQNAVKNSKVSSTQKKLVNSRKAKKNEKDINSISTSSSEDEINYKEYFDHEDQYDSKMHNLGKRKQSRYTEKSKKRKELSKKKTCRDEMTKSTRDSSEEITSHSRNQQKTKQEKKQGYSKETKKGQNKEETNKKRRHSFSSDSSEGYQAIELVKKSMMQGQLSSLANGIRTKNRYPQSKGTSILEPSVSNFKPSSSKNITARKKLEKRKGAENYQKYLKDIFQTEDLSQGTFHYGDKPKTGKNDSDDVFSITMSSSDSDEEVPKGTGVLCDLFDR